MDTNPSTQDEENGNNSATSTDENNTLDANNNAERYVCRERERIQQVKELLNDFVLATFFIVM